MYAIIADLRILVRLVAAALDSAAESFYVVLVVRRRAVESVVEDALQPVVHVGRAGRQSRQFVGRSASSAAARTGAIIRQ